ncbi:MAG: valine--tRNA ligase [Candidatus Jorgensenbacteria bacterium]
MLETRYDSRTLEARIYKLWEQSGYFNPDNLPVKKSAKNYIVYMPLPNVTGSLHMGHLLNNAIQDVLVRYERMRGKRALYLPGTDHAGIATQYVVEKELKKQGINRWELGREKFIEKVWEWKKQYGGVIFDQLKKIGISADWSRVRFTMDSAYTKDVLEAFVHYHKKGLLYRGFRTVNWCPRDGTSLSELELEYKDEKTSLWFIRYSGLIVATTRPETMLGDTAVAVNPRDKRYAKWIGGKVTLPIENREIPVIADDAIDPEFGTGAVKVTPAHDIADFEIGVRHKLPTIQVIDERGKMNARAGEYAGMKAEDAREKIVERLEREGLLEKAEPYEHRVAVCYRCGATIEPLPSSQWFLKMEGLAKEALGAVRSEKVKIWPKNFERPYRDWLSNIRDWTVSRQIWWGHQLPVWFCKNQTGISSDKFLISKPKEEQFVVALEKPKTCPFCRNCDMEQSPDVLDTWFSSALWPFAGFSEDDLKKYYPGSALITARDILNLWVARMIFSGLEFRKKLPFANVFIHGTILTKDGKRMSKSLGTGIDPLRCIERYGADAARFAAIWQATGQDIRWDEAAAVAGMKFCTKIWNAARFVIAHVPAKAFAAKARPRGITAADRTILKKLSAATSQTEGLIGTFAFSKALRGLYDFFWHEFCDIYVERSKKQLADGKLKKNTEIMLAYVLFSSLKLLHPFLPFVTEALYQELPRREREFLMIAPW